MNQYTIQDGDTVTHATINGGKEMSVTYVYQETATCQLSDGSEQEIPCAELRLVRKTGGRFFDEDEDLTDLQDNEV